MSNQISQDGGKGRGRIVEHSPRIDEIHSGDGRGDNVHFDQKEHCSTCMRATPCLSSCS